MKAVLFFFLHLALLLLRLAKRNGAHSLAAENILLRQQLLAVKRKRRRSPNLTPFDRLVFGICSFFIHPRRLPRLALVVSHASLTKFHAALVKRKYALLFSPSRGKPGPKGPSKEIVKLILEIKERNPTYGCPRIALFVSKLSGQLIDEHLVRRTLRRHFHFPSGGGPSWLELIGNAKDSLWSLDLFCCESILLKTHWVMLVMDQFSREIVGFAVHQGSPDGIAACRMFSLIQKGRACPRYLSTDNDPLFKFDQWEANPRVLEIEPIKSAPEIPISHPFVERLIGTTRREFLDDTLFWDERDLHKKLQEFALYYNWARVHYSLSGLTPSEKSSGTAPEPVDLKNLRWKSFCSGRYSVPCAA